MTTSDGKSAEKVETRLTLPLGKAWVDGSIAHGMIDRVWQQTVSQAVEA